MREESVMMSPLGKLYIVIEDDCLTQITTTPRENSVISQDSLLMKRVKLQLTEYFQGKRKTFQLPVKAAGTEFQKKVWDALLEIPYGETRSYGQIANVIGNPKGARAVGSANHHNPLMIVVPCHRVIGSGGSLVGYAGGLWIKKYLLDLEKYLMKEQNDNK